MKKDIEIPLVKNVTIALCQIPGEGWEVRIVNANEVRIDNVLVTSKGYGKLNNKDVKTSTLRHFVGDINAASSALVEPIKEDLFQLTNEYWVTYYIKGTIYDKKFIFVKGSIKSDHLTYNEILKTKAIVHS